MLAAKVAAEVSLAQTDPAGLAKMKGACSVKERTMENHMGATIKRIEYSSHAYIMWKSERGWIDRGAEG